MAARRNIKYHISFFVILIFLNTNASTSGEQVYKIVDGDGFTEFADKAHRKNASVEILDIEQINTLPSIPTTSRTSLGKKSTFQDRVVKILTPEDQGVISMGPGNFHVSVSAVPGLDSREQLQLMIDNTAVGSPQRETTWSLENVIRGQHILQVIRQGTSGEIISESPEIEILVLRPLPARR